MNGHIDRLIRALPDDLDGILITSPPNRFYFTGFSSSAGTLLVTRNGGYFFIDFRYYEAACMNIKNCGVILLKDLKSQLGEMIKGQKLRMIAVETDRISYRAFQELKGLVEPAVLSDTGRADKLINQMRQIKDSFELESFRQAQRLTDEAFLHILNYIRPGKTELELVMELGTYLAKQGSENHSFEFIFCSGSNTSLPHGGGKNRTVCEGDFVMMDFGAKINGYSADMTRTVGVGRISEEQRRVYQTVLEAQKRALEAISPNKICSEVDRIARNYIENAGYPGCFDHGLGHSLGVEIHEDPKLSPTSRALLKPNMVVTAEPGIYLKGKFGVRIEDMVFVTEDGCENLTKSSKELIML